MASAYDFSLRQLQYVVAIADTLGFRKAAERCHVSQPALSAQVQQVEDVLGVRIFERDRKRVFVTAAGEELVARARRVLLEVDDLVAVASRTRDPFTGTLRIGVIPTIAPYLLPEIAPAVHARYPKLRLALREEKTESCIAELREGKLDAALLALEAEIGEWPHAVLMKDRFVCALPMGHPLAKKARITPSDLDDQTVLLLDDGHCFRTQALSWCTKSGAHESDLRATSLATLVQMVSTGAGITLLPELAVAVENRRAQLEVRPFAEPVPSRTIALIWRPRSPLASAFEELAKTLRAASKGAPRLMRPPQKSR